MHVDDLVVEESDVCNESSCHAIYVYVDVSCLLVPFFHRVLAL